MKQGIVRLLFSGVIVLASCDRESNTDLNFGDTGVISAVELQISDEAELISEDIMGIAEDVYATDEISTVSKNNYRSDFLPDCAIVTTVTTDTSKEKTIAFGEGCELPNGNVVSGTMYLSYNKDMGLATKTVELVLENFTFNGVAVSGGASVVRTGATEGANPKGMASWSFEGVWPEGEATSFEGNRTREWIEGYGSGSWGDNVFLISGSGTHTNRAGKTHTKEIVEPLRKEWSCRFIVSGVLRISRDGNTASLDFGDGTCDAKGMLTDAEGNIEEVTLRRFSKK